MATIDRSTDQHPIPPPQQCGEEVFAEIDADDFEDAKRDPVVKTFAERADQLFSALKRPRHLRH